MLACEDTKLSWCAYKTINLLNFNIVSTVMSIAAFSLKYSPVSMACSFCLFVFTSVALLKARKQKWHDKNKREVHPLHPHVDTKPQNADWNNNPGNDLKTWHKSDVKSCMQSCMQTGTQKNTCLSRLSFSAKSLLRTSEASFPWRQDLAAGSSVTPVIQRWGSFASQL